MSAVFRGGTRVTLYGRHLDSVAEPVITISVHVTTTSSDNVTNVTDIFTDHEVQPSHRHTSHGVARSHCTHS